MEEKVTYDPDCQASPAAAACAAASSKAAQICVGAAAACTFSIGSQ